MASYYKNEYKFKKDLSDFANKNPLGRMLKPLFRGAYAAIKDLLPTPRDFLIRRLPAGGVYGEVGVYMGDFAERIFRYSSPSKLYLIDPWRAIAGSDNPKYQQEAEDKRYEFATKRLAKEIANGRAIVVRKTSDEAVNQFSDEMFDFVYIDGDHSYQQVKVDVANYYPKVKKGGMLAGDDYHLPEVKQAVDAFAKEKGLTFEVTNRQFIFIK